MNKPLRPIHTIRQRLRQCKFLPPAYVVCEGYGFTRVCLSRGVWGGIPACIAGGIPACLAAGLLEALQVSRPTPRGLPTPGGSPTPGGVSSPHPGGLQAHTWGCLQAHTWGGISRPTNGGCLQAHNRGVSQHALRQTPPNGYCCRRYASYWNAFLFLDASNDFYGNVYYDLDLNSKVMFDAVADAPCE